MLFGSIETLEQRVDHLMRLRELQDKSLSAGARDADHGGAHFQTFIPLRVHNDNNRLARLASPTGYESLRTIAVSRLLLDNIPHLAATTLVFLGSSPDRPNPVEPSLRPLPLRDGTTRARRVELAYDALWSPSLVL